MSSFHWAEIVVAVWTLLLAMWQLVLVDRSMYGLVLFWSAPALIAVAVRWHRLHSGRKSDVTTFLMPWAATYLGCMSLVLHLAAEPRVLPSFTGEHQGRTEFSEQFNKLSVVSRRVLSADVLVTGLFGFVFGGYVLFWRDFVGRPLSGQTRMSPFTNLLGLMVLWGTPALVVIAVVVALAS